MTALHAKASYWVRQGIFRNLASFEEFETRVNKITEEKDRGDIFEIFIEGYLATQSIMQRSEHWIVGNIPIELRRRYNLPKDATGIDGIYETRDGGHVAYQVKWRKSGNLTFAEVAPFLGLTEKFPDRVVFTNATTLSKKAVARTRWFSGEAFHALSDAALAKISAWLERKPIPIARAKPDPSYQTQALDDIKRTLKSHDRATAVMACGTGKTFVSLWAAEQQKPTTVLVLVPSLTLLKQTLREWSEQTSWGTKFSYLCVCSDKTVNLKNDEMNIDKSEVGFRVDTDPKVVREFLKRKSSDIKVIFSTYHSSDVVGDGTKGLPPIDLGIFDEAHKTTGSAGGMFAFALSDKNIRIKKRLFLTATPRHFDIRRRDKDGEFRVQSMDDETVYGPRAHSLSFATAAKKGIICKYKVIISIIDKKMVDDFTLKNGITLVKKDEIGARKVANLIALKQAITKVGAKKVISFHSRVNLAQEFATDTPRGIAFHLPKFDVRHVNGGQSSGEREELIGAFARSPQAIITNARCLTEGVNIPAVDMVAFIDPRQSKVDIVQAVGRAMRKPRGSTIKKVGYILVPLFAEIDGDGIEAAIKSEKFEAVSDVLNALQEHDEELVDIIREVKERNGAGESFHSKRLFEKINLIGPTVSLSRLSDSIGIAIADRLGSSWDAYYGCLTKFVARENHCRVPDKHLESGIRLGAWVGNQRARAERLTPQQIARLNALGFVWDPIEDQWEEGFKRLASFMKREKHCRVPFGHLENGFRLGFWVANQRARADRLTIVQRERLNSLSFVWDAQSSKWEKAFQHLSIFVKREKHCRVPAKHVEDQFRLGGWIGTQRAKSAKLTPDQLARLNALGFVWDPIEDQWEEGFRKLATFAKREKHCRVPRLHLENGFKLGSWVSNQRTKSSKLKPDQFARLNTLGFIWSSFEDQWEEGFKSLTSYVKREKHCRVPFSHLEDGFKLGGWVSSQRARAERLTPQQIARLNALGFVWDPIEDQWEEGFKRLASFMKREKHCRVPQLHIENGFRLGNWVANQRARDHRLTHSRRARLNKLGFIWDPIEDQWENGFEHLRLFVKREKHCRVPDKHLESGFKLGGWVRNQRTRVEKLTSDRLARLNKLGFVWDQHQEGWEEGFVHLSAFVKREKHCRVPALHLENGFKLGVWVGVHRSRFDQLPLGRRERLNKLGFVWKPYEEQWEEGFKHLKIFVKREKHCRVPIKHLENKFRLGAWVRQQRSSIRELEPSRRERLDKLGFVWSPRDGLWETGFGHLSSFVMREKHCRVPQKHIESGYKLGSWIRNQRSKWNALSPLRRQRLSQVGVVWKVK
jgi:superfamily II DNA or RNA helicase